MVGRLKKALYGLKQAHRAWYAWLDRYLLHQGFNKGTADSNLYIKVGEDQFLIVEVYLDDIIFGGNEVMCKNFVDEMQKEFEMSVCGEMNFFLRLQINQTDKGIFISQSKYVKEMLKKFGMEDSKPVCTPITIGCKLRKNDESPKANQSRYISMIRGLLCLTATRPDIMHVVCLVARFQEDPKESHVVAVKRIFGYLKGTPDHGLWYPKDNDFALSAYTDADWVGCVDDKKSTSGGAFFLGGRVVSWLSKKQDSVSLSTTEA